MCLQAGVLFVDCTGFSLMIRWTVWVGENFAGENAFKGYSTETHKFSVPMDRLLKCATDGDATPLIIERDGEEGHGRLYYRAALSYARTASRRPL